MIEVNCPHCGHLLRIPQEYAGQVGGCKHCGGRFRVPVPAGQPFEQAYPASGGPAVKRPSAAKFVIVGLVVSVVVIGAVVAGVLVALPRITTVVKGEKAHTPKQALENFAASFEEGSVRKALAAMHYTDEECARAILTHLVEMRSLLKALDAAYGEAREGQMQMSFGPGIPTVDQIRSDEVTIEEEGDQAFVHISGRLGELTRMTKKDGYWYVDMDGMMSEVPEGMGREQIVKMAEGLSQAIREAKVKIGQPGYSRQDIEMELMGKSMGLAMAAAMGGLTQQGTAPSAPVKWDARVSGPPPSDEEIVSIVRQINDATNAKDLGQLRDLVAQDCQMDIAGITQPYWPILEQNIAAFKASDMTSDIQAMEIIQKSANEAVARVVAVSSGAPEGSGRATARYVFKKYGGEWKLAELKVESVGFAMGDAGQLPIPGQPAGAALQPQPANPLLDPPQSFFALREGMNKQEVLRVIGTPAVRGNEWSMFWEVGPLRGNTDFMDGALKSWDFYYDGRGGRDVPWVRPIRPASPAQVDAIQPGMAYSDVVRIMGCDGVPRREGSSRRIYLWPAETPEAGALEVWFQCEPGAFKPRAWDEMQKRGQNWGVEVRQWLRVWPGFTPPRVVGVPPSGPRGPRR